MRDNKHFKNLAQLQQEMALLKQSYQKQEQCLREDIDSYAKQFLPSNMFKKFVGSSNLLAFDEKAGLTGRIMSIILPVLINKTIFRNSGFITRLIAALGAGKIGRSIDFDNLSSLFNLMKSFIIPANKKAATKNELVFTDYGIPADSETF